ncbi:hypothetical protein COCSUDRAFT_32263 [Coccomyxa subellipsoidea C-169]|uniref:Uncharacterized protein n=1 Tax=Coccomyxa subellipsoidea (strain C-169) TaxID=574566 RepID=I0Z7Y7_COCSC|nr:hypothetical protein COCSUDRAFT_32263 [Coccomyxa subellipsoidea C-169]EIE26756.1 hypothetical protein COCSUDRAFT_32263 [Coccomyxa subellipsoidea C-169]|eukprot:XP_005651300.1 hypothetical protein COCSUDRAFT_32263 [Coccomyxa subellipsoidea C-169]
MMRGLQDLGNHRLLMSGIGSDADAVSQSSDEVLLHLGVLSCLDGREKAGRDGLRYVHVGAQRAFTGLQHA